MKNLIRVAVIIFLISTSIFAQDKPLVVTSEARVRVLVSPNFQNAEKRIVMKESKPAVFVGRVVSFSTEQLVIVNGNETEPSTIPTAFLQKLEISQGRKSRASKRSAAGLGIGAAVGAAVGAILGGGFGECYIGDDPPEGVSNGCSKEFAVIGAASFGLAGLVIGGISGTIAGPEEEWIAMPLDPTLKPKGE